MFILTDEYKKEMYKMGLSVELTERIEADSVAAPCVIIGNELCSIWAHPPVERDDLIYFIIFKGGEMGTPPHIDSSKCTRISIFAPEYVECSDCGKEEWILNHDEKMELCKMLKDNGYWNHVLLSCMDALTSWDADKKIDISNLPMPDYMQLPEK